MRKFAYILVFIAVFSTLSSTFEQLQTGTNSEFSSNSSHLTIEITDDDGNPVSGVEITVFDGWTGLRVAGPEILQTSQIEFSGLAAGPVRITATHDNYATSGVLSNLSTEHPNDAAVSLTPLNAELNITTEAGAEIILTYSDRLGGESSTADSNGTATIAVPNSAAGWVTVTSQSNSTLTRWSGEPALNITINGTMQVHSNELENATGTIRIEHHPSNFWQTLQWNSDLNLTLPVTNEGEWRFYNVVSGVRVGAPLITPNVENFNLTALLSRENLTMDTPWEGHAYLNMTSTPELGEEFTVTWEAEYTIPSDFGSSLLPGRSQGLLSQIDRWMGNGDGVTSGSEIGGFSFFHSQFMWSETNHLIFFDEAPFTGFAERKNFSIDQGINAGDSTFSWSEEANLTGVAAFGSSRIFWLPVRGDAIEKIPITVNLPPGWEMRYSPQAELLSGNQSTFTGVRADSPTTGMWTITVGPNQAPIGDGELVDRFGLAVPLDGNVSLQSNCMDSGMTELTNAWQINHNSTPLHNEVNDTITFIPSQIGFTHGNVLNATLTCSDWDGATSHWWIDLYVDGEAPSALVNTTEFPSDGIEPLYRDMNGLENVFIRAGSEIIMVADTEDDSGAVVQVTWRSNKSENWIHEDVGFADVFNQGNGVNWMHMSVDERHLQRELTTYSLEMELTDGAGNSNVTIWNITMFDSSPPTITAEVFVDGYPIGPLNEAYEGSTIVLNLTRSFDDIDAIEKTIWAIVLDGVPILENGTWEETRLFTLPPLEVGVHDLRLYAMDSSGNVREVVSNPEVQPPIPSDISGISLDIEGEPIIGEPGFIGVLIQNDGSTNARVSACYRDQCSREWDSGEASAEKVSRVILPLEISEYESGQISVVVKWTDTVTGESGELTIESGMTPLSQWAQNADTIIGGILFLCFGYLVFKQIKQRERQPF